MLANQIYLDFTAPEGGVVYTLYIFISPTGSISKEYRNK